MFGARWVASLFLVLGACAADADTSKSGAAEGGKPSSPQAAGPSSSPSSPGTPSATKPGTPSTPSAPTTPTPPPAPLVGHEFLEDAKVLLVAGACADGTQSVVKQDIVDAHCKKLKAAQDEYKKNWLTPAKEFFATNVPKNLPKTVVYPFAGGDLSTALTVYPDADEITTLSLEPAGDARAIRTLSEKDLKAQLATAAKELSSLYTASFSVTMRMIDAMTVAQLPTQLIFSLSALSLQDYELTSVRYFKVGPTGDLTYLVDADLAAIDKIKDPVKHNKELSNVELRFHKKGSKHEQVYRHILANLDDAHVKSSPGYLKHLEAKGHVAGMTKAASYLLTFDDFNAMRKYVIDHVDWMVSDSTGLPPDYGTPAGFEYETWGTYERSNMKEGGPVTPQWKKVYAAQPKRDLKFRFGYPSMSASGGLLNHLIIMRKTGSASTAATAPAPAKK